MLNASKIHTELPRIKSTTITEWLQIIDRNLRYNSRVMLLEAQPFRGVRPCSGRALLRVRSRQQSTSSARIPITSVCGGPWDSTSACASARPAVQAEQHASAAFTRWRTPPSRRSARQQPRVPAASSGASALDGGSLQEPSSDASCGPLPSDLAQNAVHVALHSAGSMHVNTRADQPLC